MKTAYFERFEINMPEECVADCSHAGQCDADVAFWLPLLDLKLDPAKVRAELDEYGAWDEAELADDAANLQRIVWIAACNISEELDGE